eukprot:CAMPEP_0197536538 /NCGR_PEP_ID=MMETSP1318-20131121/54143_1 /TAXON_ID=552666 /ORGANISM="Partenskyella glossopodia, Strain RCC365" /LENGTH=117 /DNA_ID=CAMNT_0043094455 /DNA_START=140 /DNA_END=493 /DNA_ORIENTATION=-
MRAVSAKNPARIRVPAMNEISVCVQPARKNNGSSRACRCIGHDNCRMPRTRDAAVPVRRGAAASCERKSELNTKPGQARRSPHANSHRVVMRISGSLHSHARTSVPDREIGVDVALV